MHRGGAGDGDGEGDGDGDDNSECDAPNDESKAGAISRPVQFVDIGDTPVFLVA
ncbi:hypothetical protein [Enhygromyxa salina]|uniref:Uncharacterized protein n=1 Tax=Enhygromyxa salina TaxID=215803 RepID=A0A2S9YJA1_9BACT|nr:hypothetical protein [Enhygromyxa salina]PRQ05151.1 hypothetical protein ENSA7_47800 [Enhygromyxa salina]